MFADAGNEWLLGFPAELAQLSGQPISGGIASGLGLDSDLMKKLSDRAACLSGQLPYAVTANEKINLLAEGIVCSGRVWP